MATQISLNNAVASLNTSLEAVQERIAADTLSYWTGLLGKVYTLHSNGTVQSTCSNPVAYFLVPLSGNGSRGRSHRFVIEQFQFALLQGWTSNAHVALRGINENAIKAGMAFNMPRNDSALGTVQGRKLAHSASQTDMTKKGRAELAQTVCRIEATPSTVGKAIGLQSFNDKFEALKAAQAKRQAPKVSKKGQEKEKLAPSNLTNEQIEDTIWENKMREVRLNEDATEVTKPVRKGRGRRAA
jgi:hypothetical protein